MAAASMAYGLSGDHPDPQPQPGYNAGHAFWVELLWSFALCSVVLNVRVCFISFSHSARLLYHGIREQVATTESQEDNSFFGLAIGMTVFSGAYTVGHISSGVFNPAVGTGLLVVHGWTGGK